MQQITNQARFGFETNWSQGVLHPSGSNIVSRVANAVVAVLVNLAKSLANVIAWVPNKIHNLIYPNATKTPSAEEVEIQHDSVMVDVAEEAAVDEDLPEPVVANSNDTLMKAGIVGGAVAAAMIGTAVLARTSQYFLADTIPGAALVDNFFTQTIPNSITSGAATIKNTACWATLGYICTPRNSYAGNA